MENTNKEINQSDALIYNKITAQIKAQFEASFALYNRMEMTNAIMEISNEIMKIVDNKDDLTRGDLRGAIEAQVNRAYHAGITAVAGEPLSFSQLDNIEAYKDMPKM